MNLKFMTPILSATLVACTAPEGGYVPKEIDVADGRLTPEVIWQMGRVGEVATQEDGGLIAFTVTYTDIEKDRNYTDVYVLDLATNQQRRLTHTEANESQIEFTPDGKIAYMLPVGGKAQVFKINIDGTGNEQVTNVEEGVEGYKFSPDGEHLLYVKNVKIDQTLAQKYPDLPKATARFETDVMYRHWNKWREGYNHIFVDNVDIMEGKRYDSPLEPFGGMEQITFSPDGKYVYYTCKKLTGLAYAKSTNSGIYEYNIATKETRLVTAEEGGYDTNPVFSNNGKRMFWLSMERDGYESDKNRIMMLADGEMVDLTEDSELYVEDFCLSQDGKKIYFIADEKARESIFELDIETKNIRVVNNDCCDYTSVEMCGDRLIATRQSMKSPSEIFTINTETGEAVQISHINDKTLEQIKFGEIEERWVPTTDGKEMLVWVVYPPEFDKSKKYPALLYCQGGPQSTVSQFWSLRWNLELMASNGYIVVAPNRHGLPGFGREWNEQISGDYGGQNMQDYLSAIDNVARDEWVDASRLGAVGASYGGFSVYWLAGHHEGRFKAFIAHCGVFNLEDLYETTEEMFFPDWDLGGAPWDDNETAKRSYASSPHLFVGQWDTPIMVIHGEKDFRIPYTQGMAAFNSAVLRGIPAEFLYFPDECHWVSKPQNSILWHREFYSWLEKWLK